MKIALLSSGYMHVDPRILFLADKLQKNGHELIFLNIELHEECSSFRYKHKIFKNYNIKFDDYVDINHSILSSFSFTESYIIKIRNFVKNFLSSSKSEILMDVDLIYGCELFMGGLISLELSKKMNIFLCVDFKELFSEMSFYTSDTERSIIKIKEKEVIEHSIVIPCVSQKIIDYYSALYPQYSHKFILLENSRPFDHLSPSFENNKKKKVKFIVSSGSAGHGRGVKELLKIWELLNPKNAELYLRFSNIKEEEKKEFNEITIKTMGKNCFYIPSVSEANLVDSLLGYDCGIIPYLPNATLNERYCCPNKFGQYMNAGLAIVSSNTENITDRIKQYNLGIVYDPENTTFSVKQFKSLISNSKNLLQKRINAYKFAQNEYEWNNSVKPFISRLNLLSSQLKIAVFYIENNNFPQTVRDNLESFKKYSKHQIFYFAYNDQKTLPDLKKFDCLVIHYYGQVYTDFSESFVSYLKKFKGLKVIFAQDEFDRINSSLKKYSSVQPDILYSASSISPQIQEVLYPKALIPKKTEIIHYLTGYIENNINKTLTSIYERKIDIFYRGNTLGIAYGKLGYEKIQIGLSVKNAAIKKGLNTDIETDINKQIYGMAYLENMQLAKCTLITESGSSLIDFDEQYRLKIIEDYKKNPQFSFEDIQKKYPDFYKNDGVNIINVISPKVFEAIVCKTALIGYEGYYSGILKPNVHYIPLKKDHSNLDEILSLIQDNGYLQKLVNRAFHDIVESKKYHYENFIQEFDQKISNRHIQK